MAGCDHAEVPHRGYLGPQPMASAVIQRGAGGSMRIVIPHHTDKASARLKIEARLADLLGQHGHYMTDITQHWEGDRLIFSGTAKGFKANGSVEITDSEVIVDGKLPLIARPFESRIKSTVEREAETMFRTA
jgi:Putative polyhydroxyalkanoic acid system protein (PHA_gran_rgn)